MPPFLPLQGVLVANAEDDNMQLAANATTINVRKRSAGSSFDMLAAAVFDQRLYSVTRKRRVTGSRILEPQWFRRKVLSYEPWVAVQTGLSCSLTNDLRTFAIDQDAEILPLAS
jgi:hypothetical protein